MIVPLHWILLKKSIAPSISSLCGRNLLVKALRLWPWAVYWLSSSQWIENNENHPGERRLVEYSGGNYKILATVWSVLASPIRLAAWELRIEREIWRVDSSRTARNYANSSAPPTEVPHFMVWRLWTMRLYQSRLKTYQLHVTLQNSVWSFPTYGEPEIVSF